MFQALGVVPVVTVWPSVGPLFRTRSHRSVFSFCKKTKLPEKVACHRWLAKPLPPGADVLCTVTSPPVPCVLVRARREEDLGFKRMTSSVFGTKQNCQLVVLLAVGFRNTTFPGPVRTGVPRK